MEGAARSIAFLYGAALFCGRIVMLIPCVHTSVLFIDVLPAFSVNAPHSFAGAGFAMSERLTTRIYLLRPRIIYLRQRDSSPRTAPSWRWRQDTAGTGASRNFLKTSGTNNVPQLRAQGKQLFAQATRHFMYNSSDLEITWFLPTS